MQRTTYLQALARLAPSSFRTRYLYVATFLSILFVTAAVIGWNYVEHSTTGQITYVQVRALAKDAVSDTAAQFRTLENSLQRFIILPNEANQLAVERALELQQVALTRLQATDWVKQHPEIKSLVEMLRADADDLTLESRTLKQVRLSVRDWLPAARIMQDRMLPQKIRFSGALDTTINEAANLHEEDRQRRIYDYLVQLRDASTRMISEFRLYVSNRFGIFFADSETGMQARATNINMYLNQVDNLLNTLVLVDGQYGLDLQQAESLAEMRDSFDRWTAAYSEVTAIFESDEWRYDLVLLNSAIDPLFSRVQERLSILELELDIGSARDITDLTDMARYLSRFVIFLAAAGILAIALGFVSFQRTLLRPILDTTRMLKAEARGEPGEVLPLPTSEETRNLAEAFSEMRQQVASRQKKLDYMAHHDALTELPNRTLFRDRLEHAIVQSQRQGTRVGLLFLDLDRFKQINDSLGHDVGDRLLQSVAERLQSSLRKGDTIARLGGDEFAVVAEGAEAVDQIACLAEKVVKEFALPFTVCSRGLHVGTSVGIALYPDDAADAETLIRNADTAMYQAKGRGGNACEFFSPEMALKMRSQLDLEMHMRKAFEQGEFELHYQPIADLHSGSIYACEALLRWSHPERGPVSPAEFVPVLDKTGLIVPVSHWVLEEAITHARVCREAGLDALAVTVNLSARMLHGDDFVDTIKRVLRDTGMQGSDLIVEITEDTLTRDFAAADKALRALKTMGVQIALDDFGTGQSSLNHLRLAPIDIVKIDREFVRDIPGDRHDCDLVTAIIAMAKSLKIRVVAEGVETDTQLAFLRRHHCDSVQGYLISRPAPATQLREILANVSQHISSAVTETESVE